MSGFGPATVAQSGASRAGWNGALRLGAPSDAARSSPGEPCDFRLMRLCPDAACGYDLLDRADAIQPPRERWRTESLEGAVPPRVGDRGNLVRLSAQRSRRGNGYQLRRSAGPYDDQQSVSRRRASPSMNGPAARLTWIRSSKSRLPGRRTLRPTCSTSARVVAASSPMPNSGPLLGSAQLRESVCRQRLPRVIGGNPGSKTAGV